jgi:TolB protein
MRKILPALVAGAFLLASCDPTSSTDNSGGGGGSSSTPTHLSIQVQPTLVDIGTVMAPALKVRVLDASNAVVDSSDVDSVTVTITPGSGSVGGAFVSGTTTRPVIAGVATFSDLTFSDEGTGFTLTFFATHGTGVADAISSPFDVTNNANYILFSRRSGGTWEVWRMKEDGSQQAAVTTRAMASDPTPSKNPASGKVAFSDGPFGIQALYTMNVDGSGIRQVQTRSDAGETSWSPNGFTIASRVAAGAPSFGLFTINGDGTNRQQLGGGVQDMPTWSPASDEIAYTANYISLRKFGAGGGDGSLVVEVDTSSQLKTFVGDSFPGFTNSAAAFVPYTYGSTLILHPAWSPDGMRIAFELVDANGVSHIFAISNLGAGVVVPLTNHATLSDGSPTWSPDGTKIFFHSNRSGTWQIWSMNADGSNLVQLTTTAENHSPSWWN